MHRPPRYKRKAWRRTKPTAPGFRLPWSSSLRSSDDSLPTHTRKENIAFATIGIAALVAAIFILNFLTGWGSQHKREQYLERLRVNYSLNERQLDAIRRIENEYHGSGGVLFRPSHTYEEDTAHRISISQQMPPDEAARFLTDQQNKTSSISHRRH